MSPLVWIRDSDVVYIIRIIDESNECSESGYSFYARFQLNIHFKTVAFPLSKTFVPITTTDGCVYPCILV